MTALYVYSTVPPRPFAIRPPGIPDHVHVSKATVRVYANLTARTSTLLTIPLSYVQEPFTVRLHLLCLSNNKNEILAMATPVRLTIVSFPLDPKGD